jgi:hypothetical protein
MEIPSAVMIVSVMSLDRVGTLRTGGLSLHQNGELRKSRGVYVRPLRPVNASRVVVIDRGKVMDASSTTLSFAKIPSTWKMALLHVAII